MALQAANGPVPVLRWGPYVMRKIEHVRDGILSGLGTYEALIPERGEVAMFWRKPLRFEEVAQMADTPEVRARRGRP